MKTIQVVAAVITQQHKILCAQRGPSKSLPHKWEFPGGKIETGESPEQALHREIKEELNCDIKVGQRITQTTHTYDFAVVHLTTFFGKVVNGEPVPTEHAALAWRAPHELPALDWADADIPTVEAIQNLSPF